MAATEAKPALVQRLEPELTAVDPVGRMRAIKEIAGLAVRKQLASEDGKALLGIVEKVPDTDQVVMIDALMIGMREEWVAAMEETAERVGPAARERIMVGLATHDVPGAGEALARVFEKYADEPHAATWIALETPKKGRAGMLVEMMESAVLRGRAVHVAKMECDRRMIEPAEIAGTQARLIAMYREDVNDPERAGEARELLGLFACLPKGEIDAVLKEAMGFEDDLTALAAVESLMAHRVKIPGAVMERLAASDQTRAALFEMTRGKRFPSGWKTQEALARSLLVQWLADQGVHVEEIEGTGEIIVGDVEHYGFRFRSEPAGEWMLGVSGPFRKADEPTLEDHGGTWSDLSPAGRRTPASLVDGRDVREEFSDRD